MQSELLIQRSKFGRAAMSYFVLDIDFELVTPIQQCIWHIEMIDLQYIYFVLPFYLNSICTEYICTSIHPHPDHQVAACPGRHRHVGSSISS